jgi:glycosyltransferase involved in cell wall biosynthesis
MSKRWKKTKKPAARGSQSGKKGRRNEAGLRDLYRRAGQLAECGDHAEARRLYGTIIQAVGDPKLKALIANDLAALAALEGDSAAAADGFHKALALDHECEPARANLAFLEAEEAPPAGHLPGLYLPQPAPESHPSQTPAPSGGLPAVPTGAAPKIPLLSFLFNWPSTAGGIVHTAELAQFLGRAGYQVRHFYPRYTPWEIGQAQGTLPFDSEALDFTETTWTVRDIQQRFRQAVDRFGPHWVLVTDTWSFKPHLAEAMRGYPTFLRFQALECLCPLNNVRLLVDGPGRVAQCPRHQLATPEGCCQCLMERGRQSGPLHRAERELAGVGTREYYETLRRALREAEAVLVLNPFTEAMLSPYARRVEVVPWGMDPARFPWPGSEEPLSPNTSSPRREGRIVIFQAGVVDEFMKGFAVLHAACERLWRKRQDFELVATGEPAGPVDAWTRFTGWVSQADLPPYYRAADIVAVPTIAQEGLSRTSVEAMAAGRPVVASRIGGLPFTVADGATGLLCEPGHADDLARKLEILLNDADLRQRMGLAGRRRFEQDFTWDVVIDRYYRPLLQKKV